MSVLSGSRYELKKRLVQNEVLFYHIGHIVHGSTHSYVRYGTTPLLSGGTGGGPIVLRVRERVR